MIEEWKPIPDYDGIYEASNLGNIRSVEGKETFSKLHGVRQWKSRVLKQKIHENKYGRKDARICLWKNGICKTFLVSRIVASAWCDGYCDGLTVNHKNGNPLDNRAMNLEWVTMEENHKHAMETGLANVSQRITTLLKCKETGEEFSFYSMGDASRWLGHNRGYIYDEITRNHKITSRDGRVYDAILTR